ncbi:hypothetical protein [uncultured Clostridium sp.]|uniref:hypothetical protein n=1 Tax=uncultured Clostridium sp. TaxID=59620 RepID=UPI0025F6470A|nr:hypothetical protein [uncultured Clostridium sp.]
MKNINYYILLGLDIDPPEMREDKIREAINRKRVQWSSLVNHPTKKIEAKLNLELIPSMEKTLLGSRSDREKQLKEAKKILEKQKEKEKNEFVELFNIISKKQYITNEEYLSMINKFPIIKKDIEDKCKNLVKEMILDVRETDTILNRRIEENLRILCMDNLYDFLEVSENASLAEIKKASKRIYDEIRVSSKKDAVLTVRGELQGFCDVVFKNIESKLEYDRHLRDRKLKNIDDYLTVLGSKKFILKEEFDDIVGLMRKMDYEIEEAKEYVLLYAIRNKISIVDSEDMMIDIRTPKKEIIKEKPIIESKNSSKYKIDEVEILDTLSGEGKIEIDFKKPNGAKTIEVWRKEGAMPKSRGDGVKVDYIEDEKIVDKELDENKTYGYILFSIFERNGRLQYSDGVTTFATPKSTKDNNEIFHPSINDKKNSPGFLSWLMEFFE